MKHLLRDERGQDMIEYALLVGFILGAFSALLMILDALTNVNQAVEEVFNRVSPPCHQPDTYWADSAHTQINSLPPAPGTCR